MPDNPTSLSREKAFIKNTYPAFYDVVADFPDFTLKTGLSNGELTDLEQRLDCQIPEELKTFLENCSSLAMNGLSISAAELGPIIMPSSEALVIGRFYLHDAADRLLMLPQDPSVYYLEQHNGAITRLAGSLAEFFGILPRYL